MKPARNILAITVVAVALYTDRTAFCSTAQPRVHRPTLAGQIVRKLQLSFRRIVPQAARYEAQVLVAPPQKRALEMIVAPDVGPVQLSPFEFRLPPPTMK